MKYVYNNNNNDTLLIAGFCYDKKKFIYPIFVAII